MKRFIIILMLVLVVTPWTLLRAQKTTDSTVTVIDSVMLYNKAFATIEQMLTQDTFKSNGIKDAMIDLVHSLKTGKDSLPALHFSSINDVINYALLRAKDSATVHLLGQKSNISIYTYMDYSTKKEKRQKVSDHLILIIEDVHPSHYGLRWQTLLDPATGKVIGKYYPCVLINDRNVTEDYKSHTYGKVFFSGGTGSPQQFLSLP